MFQVFIYLFISLFFFKKNLVHRLYIYVQLLSYDKHSALYISLFTVISLFTILNLNQGLSTPFLYLPSLTAPCFFPYLLYISYLAKPYIIVPYSAFKHFCFPDTQCYLKHVIAKFHFLVLNSFAQKLYTYIGCDCQTRPTYSITLYDTYELLSVYWPYWT